MLAPGDDLRHDLGTTRTRARAWSDRRRDGEAGCRFRIEGRDGVGVVELGWQPQYLEHLQTKRHEPVI
jgi:hypothetical protein